jgi:serine/threonine protein kinase
MRYPTDDDIDCTEELDEFHPAPVSVQSGAIVAPAAVAQVREGAVLRDRYVLGRPLAESGRSIVFAAQDLRRDVGAGESSDVAIKVLSEEQRHSAAAIARLRREFRQTQALRHPGAVRMYDLDCDRDTWFITMEKLEGVSLKSRLERESGRALNTAEAIRIAFGCADVLDCAHQQGTPHGDFKPGNVFLDESGAVKVLDFGAAADIPPPSGPADPDAGTIPRSATRSYASPEVLDGLAPEPSDDVFSFTCVVYEMLAGRHPFDRVPANDARDAAREVAPLPQLAPAQNAALLKGLAWTRAERPGSAQALMQSVLKADVAVAAVSPEAAPVPPSTRTRSRPLRWSAGWLVAAVLGAGIWFAFIAAERNHEVAAVSKAPTQSAPKQTVPAPAVPAPPASAVTSPPVTIKAAEPAVATEPERADSTKRTTPPPPVIRDKVSIEADSPSITVSEGAPSAVILLRRQGDRSAPAQVTWRLADGSARAGQDYDGPTKGTVRFPAGQTSRALYIPLVNDQAKELQEFFTLSLAPRPTALGKNRQVTITIDDDD